MISMLERFKSQKSQLAQTAVNLEDEAMALVLAGKPLTPEHVACLDDQQVALAERRIKEASNVADGDAATEEISDARQLVFKHRQALQAAIDAANAKFNPLIINAERVVQGLTDRESRGRHARDWLVQSTPEHVAVPLKYFGKRLMQEEQYLDRNLGALNQAKARLSAAKDGTLSFPDALPMSSGWRGADADNRTRVARDKQYSSDAIAGLKQERDRLQGIYAESKQRVDDLRDKVGRLEKLRMQPWPTRASVTEIVGEQWDPVEAAKHPAPESINVGYGTPSEARIR